MQRFTMLMTAVDAANKCCWRHQPAALPEPAHSSRASSWRGASRMRPPTTCCSTATGHSCRGAVFATPAACVDKHLRSGAGGYPVRQVKEYVQARRRGAMGPTASEIKSHCFSNAGKTIFLVGAVRMAPCSH